MDRVGSRWGSRGSSSSSSNNNKGDNTSSRVSRDKDPCWGCREVARSMAFRLKAAEGECSTDGAHTDGWREGYTPVRILYNSGTLARSHEETRCRHQVTISLIFADYPPNLDPSVVPAGREHTLTLPACTNTPVDRIDIAYAVCVSNRRDGLDGYGVGC